MTPREMCVERVKAFFFCSLKDRILKCTSNNIAVVAVTANYLFIHGCRQ